MISCKKRMLFELSDYNRSTDHGYNHIINLLKGLGILLMILGHCTSLPSNLFNCIYSFHMPLFFICSGLFFKEKDLRELTTNLAKKLIKPYVFYGLLTIGICLLFSSPEIVKSRIEGFIFGNGSPLYYPIFDIKFGLIGPVWFLMALFWCRIIYNFLHQRYKHTFLVSIIIGVIAIIIGRKVMVLPLSFLEGCSALVFYAIGDNLRSFDRICLSKIGWGISIVLFLFCCLFSSLRMSEFWYTLYPLDVVAAVIGTYFCYLFCKSIKNRQLTSVLDWFGRNSLMILCIHQLMLNIQNLLPFANISGWIAIAYNFIISILVVISTNNFKTSRL